MHYYSITQTFVQPQVTGNVFAIVVDERWGMPDLDSHKLGSERLVVTCTKEHRLAGRSVKALTDLRAERWLAFPEDPQNPEISASHIFSLFRTLGIGDLRWTPIDSLTAQKRLVEAGFGIALMPKSAIDEELSVRTVSAIRVKNLNAANPIAVVTRRGGFLSAAGRCLLAILRTGFAEK